MAERFPKSFQELAEPLAGVAERLPGLAEPLTEGAERFAVLAERLPEGAEPLAEVAESFGGAAEPLAEGAERFAEGGESSAEDGECWIIFVHTYHLSLFSVNLTSFVNEPPRMLLSRLKFKRKSDGY